MATSTTATQPLPQFQPIMNDYWARAQEVANVGYEQSPGTYVGPNQTLQDGWAAIQNRAVNGNPAMSAAQQGLQGFYGQQQQGATRNPYSNVTPGSNNTYVTAPGRTGNVSAGNNNMQVGGGYNPYASASNPHLTQQIDAAQGDVIRNWNDVQKPSWDSQMAGSGSFGNANIAAAAGNASSDMQRNLGRISSDMRMGAYNQAAGLTESGLNRSLGAQQFNVGTATDNINRQYGAGQFNAGLNEAYNSRNMNAQQFNAGQRDRNLDRQFSGQQFNANQGQDFAQRSDSMYGQNQNRMLQAYGMAPQFANQDYVDANALIGVGNAQQGYNQAQQNQNNDWWNQSQAYAGGQLDAYGRRLGLMQPGSSTTQSTPNPGVMQQVIGGAAAGAGLANWWGG